MAATRPPSPALSDAPLAPGLYLVATPIGNLRDITLRALDVLAGVDLVLAEDTRITGKLLSTYGLSKPLERYDDHAGERMRPRVLSVLAAGGRIALCSDAGTPLVSDPGYRLVVAAIAQGHAVIPIPGASSVLAALSAAGLPTDRLVFAGFPPPSRPARRAFFETLAPVRATLVLFEGASRLRASLGDMAAVFGQRQAVVARELTKLHETHHRGRPGRSWPSIRRWPGRRANWWSWSRPAPPPPPARPTPRRRWPRPWRGSGRPRRRRKSPRRSASTAAPSTNGRSP